MQLFPRFLQYVIYTVICPTIELSEIQCLWKKSNRLFQWYNLICTFIQVNYKTIYKIINYYHILLFIRFLEKPMLP